MYFKIKKYLCDEDAKAQARVDEYLEWQHQGIGVSLYFYC